MRGNAELGKEMEPSKVQDVSVQKSCLVQNNTSGQLGRKQGRKACRGWRGEGHELRGQKKAGRMVTPLMIKLKRWKDKVKMCWEPMEVALCLNIECSSPWKASISLLNLILSYNFRKCSQFVLPRCGNYYSFIYWTCFRNIHQKNVMSQLFKFCFQNIFSELKQIVEINYKGLAESRMFSSRFAWLMISPDGTWA